MVQRPVMFFFDGTKISAVRILVMFEHNPNKEFVNVDYEKKRVTFYRDELMHGSTEYKIRLIEEKLEKHLAVGSFGNTGSGFYWFVAHCKHEAQAVQRQGSCIRGKVCGIWGEYDRAAHDSRFQFL